MAPEVRGAHQFVLHSGAGTVSTGQLYSAALACGIKSNYCSRCCMFSDTGERRRWHSGVKMKAFQVCFCGPLLEKEENHGWQSNLHARHFLFLKPCVMRAQPRQEALAFPQSLLSFRAQADAPTRVLASTARALDACVRAINQPGLYRGKPLGALMLMPVAQCPA